MHPSSQSSDRNSGFTLIELLVVMIVIGILAAIAIPTFLNQRKNAWRASSKSDLRNAAAAAESWATDRGYGSFVGLDSLGLDTARAGHRTADVTVSVAATGITGYCLEATNANLPGEVQFYDSGVGAPVVVDCSGKSY